jgi:DNA-binding NarL/FixJ family response regulator
MNVLVIDDHPLMVTGIKQSLGLHFPGCRVSGAATGGIGLQLVRQQPWDLVLLDLDLPDRSGLDLLREIRSFAPRVPVLVLSAKPENEFGLAVLKGGAQGFVSKMEAPAAIMEAIGKLLAGRRHISSRLAEKLAANLDTDTDVPPHERLSSREFQVLLLLGSGKPVSAVAGELRLSVKTVSTYRTRLLNKMGLKGNAELIRYVVERRLAR